MSEIVGAQSWDVDPFAEPPKREGESIFGPGASLNIFKNCAVLYIPGYWPMLLNNSQSHIVKIDNTTLTITFAKSAGQDDTITLDPIVVKTSQFAGPAPGMPHEFDSGLEWFACGTP